MTDEKSIWNVINKWNWFRLLLFLWWSTRSRYEMLIIKKIDSDFFFLFFWSFNFSFLNLSFFSLVISCACIWQLVTIFVFFSSFCSSWCVFRSSFFVLHNFSRFIFVISRLFSMKKKKIVLKFFDDAKTNELISLNEAKINNDKVSKNLESDTEINYDRMLHFWHEWIFVHDFANLIKSWKHSLKIYFDEIDMRKETLTLAFVIWKQ